MNRNRNLRRGSAQTWILLVCVVIGAGILWYQYDRLEKGKVELAATESKIELTKATLKATTASAATGQARVVPATKEEEAEFVEHFRTLAAVNGVDVVRWTAQPAPQAPPPDPGAPKPATPAIPAVTSAAVNVELAGTYEAVRKMIDELMKGKRLVAIEDATWERLEEGRRSRLQCRIVRFVGPPAPEESAGAAEPVSSAEHGGSR